MTTARTYTERIGVAFAQLVAVAMFFGGLAFVLFTHFPDRMPQ